MVNQSVVHKVSVQCNCGPIGTLIEGSRTGNGSAVVWETADGEITASV